jgi:hypothetical protein
MKLRVPYVTVANALYIDFSGYTPAGIFGWPHETTPEALARNLQAGSSNEGKESQCRLRLGYPAHRDSGAETSRGLQLLP